MKWSSHPVAHLRKVAIAYKKELGVGAVSKMSKPDLVVLLDKHLILGDDGKISIKGKSTESKDLEEILESKKKEEEEVKPKMKREVKESKAMEKKEGQKKEVEKMVKIMNKKKMY
tara:strand:- start:10 stop:354 length:345 start_codon:yes stop_codon:yes gene_type:complete